MEQTWFDLDRLVLTARAPVPLHRPFTGEEVVRAGISRHDLRRLVHDGYVRRLLQGVYAASTLADSMLVRTQALALVVPPEAVVTDRTAAWLHGVDVLVRGSRSAVPPLQAFHTTDTRMHRPGVESGRRGLLPGDVTEVYGVRTTTALRTALDLGRLLWRFDALAAIDGFLRIGVPHEILAAETSRFRGYRGVCQLRALVPLGDPLAESPGESALRLHWYDAGLPRPELQVWVHDDDGRPRYRLDLALPALGFCAEYDGEEFHVGEEAQAHDADRRAWCTDERGWYFEVFTKVDVYGRNPDPHPQDRLQAGVRAARRQVAWTPYDLSDRTRTPLWTP